VLGDGAGPERGATSSSGFHLTAGADQSARLRFPAPFTIEAVTVERGGAARRSEPAATLEAGRAYELIVHPDGTAEVIAR
jgi:hypothetical protein